ncbi:MAG: tRNA preQ1(34) S-adenosylmethionine ribosyltransferase-isomerase QueA [Actinomycetota bacterium]
MLVSDFDYDLPDDRIAQAPVEPRHAARLLVDRGPGNAAEHHRVRDLPTLLRPGDLLVVNRSRVLAARLELRKSSGGRVEILLLEPVAAEPGTWRALVRPSRRVAAGTTLEAGPLRITAGADDGDGVRLVELHHDGHPVDAALADEVLADVGRVPLPPYIHRPLEDQRRYQTVFASAPGSVAAPTAGLHLTPEVLDDLRVAGIEVAEVELHVGLDTFRPMTSDDPDEHRMHSERFVVDDEVLVACERATRVVAVGTTTVRSLESAVRGITDRTDIFIRPPWEWRVVDVMMTNFHLPRTTLLMMVEAFVGSRWRELYATALDEGYRFLSFGDAMLLERSR